MMDLLENYATQFVQFGHCDACDIDTDWMSNALTDGESLSE